MNKKKRILLVEDEAVTALAEQQQLENYGYDVKIVSTGEDAVSAVTTTSEIDLILMDINLGPGIDGTEAAKKILTRYDMPIIFLSSHTEPDVVALTERITSYGYVVKQSGITVLDASIKMAFRLYKEKMTVNQHREEIDAANEELQAAVEEMEATSEELHATNEQLLHSQESLMQHEKELKKSEQRYRGLFNSLIEGASLNQIIYDESGKAVDYEIIDVNERYLEIQNRSKEDVINRRASQIYGPEYNIKMDVFARVAETGNPEKFDIYYPSYEKYYNISAYSPEKGQVAIIFEDVTQNKETERLLKDNEEKYRTYIENAPEGIFISNNEGRYIDVNEAACRMTGYRREELLSMNLFQLVSPHAKRTGSFDQLKEEGKVETETILRKKSGEDCHIALSAVALSENRFMAYCSDITERKKSEEQLKQKHFDLIRSQEIAKVGSWKWTLEDNKIEWSDMMYKIYGLEHGSIPETDKVRSLILPEDRSTFDQAMKSIPTGKIPDKIKYRIKKENHEIRHIIANTELTLDEEGNITGLLGVVEDATDDTLSLQKISQLLEEKDLIMREVHHRIKNDMSTIRSLISLQAMQSENQDVKAILTDAESRIILMGNIYNMLYRGKDVNRVALSDFLRSLIDSVEKSSSLQRGIKVKTNLEPLQISARDSFPVGIIINELLSNALKYAFPEDQKGEITISVHEKEKGVLKITVADSGTGIPEDILRRKSYGFGLLLVETLAKQYKGTLDISGNSGTVVSLTLPLRED